MKIDATTQFGSDVFEPLTYLYGWKANQVAHAGMGFAGATLFAYTAAALDRSYCWALVFLIIPVLKDITDYLVDINSGRGVFKITKPIKKELCYDGVTDFFFWSSGTLLALLFYFAAGSSSPKVYGVLLFAALYIGGGGWVVYRYYGPRKKRFDQAGLPFYWRLPMLRCGLMPADDAVALVYQFIHEQRPGHLVLSGPAGCGKTRLSCAIGTHLTTRKTAVWYRTFEKLRDDLLQWKKNGPSGDEIEQLRSAQVVICDDVLPPYESDLESDLREALSRKRVLWVMARHTEDIAVWKQWLHKVFQIDALPVITIVPPPDPAAASDRPAQQMISHFMSWLTLGIAIPSILFAVGVLIFM
jgi:hypothetical protein